MPQPTHPRTTNSAQPSHSRTTKGAQQRTTKPAPKGQKHGAGLWYTIASIWFAIGIINFILEHNEIGAIFAAIGLLQLIVAILQDIREKKKNQKD